MFPITIPTLVTEEVYQRFAWSIFLRGKSFLLNIIILIGILSLYLTFLPDNLKRFSFFTVLFISLVTFSAMYFGMDFQIKKAYQKTPFWKIWSKPLYLRKINFLWRANEESFFYSYDDIVKVFHTKDDFLYHVEAKYRFPYRKKELFSRGSWVLARTSHWAYVKEKAG